jgi:hypothetical protein
MLYQKITGKNIGKSKILLFGNNVSYFFCDDGENNGQLN